MCNDAQLHERQASSNQSINSSGMTGVEPPVLADGHLRIVSDMRHGRMVMTKV